jgi:hypothetical protein
LWIFEKNNHISLSEHILWGAEYFRQRPKFWVDLAESFARNWQHRTLRKFFVFALRITFILSTSYMQIIKKHSYEFLITSFHFIYNMLKEFNTNNLLKMQVFFTQKYYTYRCELNKKKFFINYCWIFVLWTHTGFCYRVCCINLHYRIFCDPMLDSIY